MTEQLDAEYDIVICGGGAAGLNAALMLVRSRRSVLVVDAGSPRNAPADAMHGILGRDGMAPGQLLERGRAEVREYGGQIVAGEVVSAVRAGDGFTVNSGDGRTVRARRLLVATGLVDELPDVSGLQEHWGAGLVHCPYCHGWEVRDRAIGVIASGPMSVHQTLMFRQWSSDITFFTHTQPSPNAEDAEKFVARGIDVVEGELASVQSSDGRITGVRLRDGESVARDVLAVGARMVARAGFLDALGLRPVEHPSGTGEHIPADPTGRTEVPGVWVAGNVTDLAAQVGDAAAAGAAVARQINAELVADDTQRAVDQYRERTEAVR